MSCHSVIIGLDPGTKFGWSVFVNGTLAQSGTFVSLQNGERRGLRYNRVISFLTQVFEQYATSPRDTLVGYEDIDVHVFKSKDNLRVYAGLVACIEMVCAAFSIDEIRGVNPSSLKVFATGDTKATKQQMMVEASFRFGINLQTDDHADACLVGDYFREYPCPTMEPSIQRREENKRKKAERKARMELNPKKSTPSSPTTKSLTRLLEKTPTKPRRSPKKGSRSPA